VSDRYGNAESESSLRYSDRTVLDGNANVFAEKFVIQSGGPEIRGELKPSDNPSWMIHPSFSVRLDAN
jgi:hypothetical protein